MSSSDDATLEALSALLKETLISTERDEATQKLTQAQELVQTLQVRSKGVLAKFRLDGKVALVTGGGQGIGRAFCHALGEAGCKVAVADLELSRAETVAAELEAKNIPSCSIQVNVSNKKQVELMIQTVLEKFGDLDIACNNAGIAVHSHSEETSEAEWNTTLGVNLNGAFFCCQAEAQHMLKKGYGKIINTASMSATICNRPQHQVAYNTSKAGVAHMTKCLGAEWANRGVRVNCISPGYVDTPLLRLDNLIPLKKLWLEDTPMGRLADVEDLTGAVIYLASSLSDHMTGQSMVIDGGFTCW